MYKQINLISKIEYTSTIEDISMKRSIDVDPQTHQILFGKTH